MTDLLLSIFLIPLVILFNSFFIGKLIRRYSINVNAYIATTIGFFIYICLMFIFFSFLYVSSANILVYLIFSLTVQILLIGLYIWNYRYVFISRDVEKKSLSLFLILVILTTAMLLITILIAYKTKPMSIQMQSIVSEFTNNFTKTSNIVAFYKDNFTFQDFSIFSVIASISRPLFHISEEHLVEYLFWQQAITFIIIFSCTITGFFYNKVNHKNLWLLIPLSLFSLLILTFSFMFYESPIIGYSWVSIPIIFYCYQTFHQAYHDEHLDNNILLIIVVGFTALDVDLTLLALLLLFFNLCYTSYKKANPIGQTIYCLFPFAYAFFIWLPLFSSVPYVILLTLCFIGALVMILLYSRNVFRQMLIKANQLSSLHPLFIIILASVIIYIFSIFFTITIFHYKFSWVLWPESSYNYIFGIDMKQLHAFNFNLVFNIISWVIVAGLFIFAIVLFTMKKINFISRPYLLLIVLMIFLFINPLSLNLFLKISEQTSLSLLDLGLINFMIIIPFILWNSNSVVDMKWFDCKEKVHVQN